MLFFAAYIVALAVTMALIPPLIHLSRRLGLLDQPNERKIHSSLIPRIGGIGMVAGFLLPVFIWVPLGREFVSLLAGIGVLLLFGILDDRGDLDYRLKLLGQVIAVAIVVFYGNVVVAVVPFFGLDPVPEWLSVTLTFIALIAVTNAINLADGLDGLAAGVTLLSLAGIAVLAYLVDGTEVLLIALALMGAITGFLRFNTYPARIFMGDAGSQFLGFAVGVLLVILTQQTNPALNPAIPLLLFGLPLFDTMFVSFKRIYHGKSPFLPDKNHVHHQLLALRFDHYEAVIIIYLVQAVFVVAGILMRYQSDSLVILAWCCANIILAILLTSAGRYRWYAHNSRSKSLPARWMEWDISFYLGRVSIGIIGTGIPLLLIVGPLMTTSVERDLGIAASILALLLLLRIVYGSSLWVISFRLIFYVTAAFVVYMLEEYPPALALLPKAGYVYFGLLAGALVIGAWSSLEDAFEVTPTDFLIVLILIGLAFLPGAHVGDEKIIQMAIKLVILFYAIEYLLRNIREKWSRVALISLWALGVITFRGLFS